jgi:hypothetical protein
VTQFFAPDDLARPLEQGNQNAQRLLLKSDS